jgi:isoleucyl-tRNA synthetase
MVKKPRFAPVTPNTKFPELEERVIAYWKKNKIFEKSVAKPSPAGAWTFLDGPPFITGLPHYGSLLSSIPKDLFPRYKTMRGYSVRRVWGWDCHGLPAENKVEAELGIKRKRDIEEKVGVAKFIAACKSYVQNVSGEWEWYVDHVGRWVDFANAYRTMDTPYMESVMWVFGEMYKKNLIYKGLRVSLYCPHCVTPISNFEVAMDADNYKDLTEPTAVYMYPLADAEDTYLLAWSTTPWNKLATTALAVNPKLTYVQVREGDKQYILAKDTIKMLTSEPYKVIREFKGKDLVGKKFVPHYDYYPIEKGKKAFVVIPGDFVTADEGTGIVTIAAYGEEDLAAMQEANIQVVLHVDEEGMLKKSVPKFGGMYYLKADPLIIEDLQGRGLIYRVDQNTHTVPHCWRCHTRLFYSPQDAWYVNVQGLKDRMKKTNAGVNWYPGHFKMGRYLKSLESAPDWCISRSRYWGSPVPVWECPNGHRFVPGSIAELEKAAGKKITDLHKPQIDEVTVQCKECKEKAHRVPEVLDSWIEAGSASFAERHFPFEKSDLKGFFPPDFIVEYTGQIRAWFYVLHVIATALYDSPAFKNVVVTGVILGTDGRKMSKNYGNYPDPKEMLGKYGGDALRLYLLGSPVMHGEDIRISEEDYRLQVRGILLLLWNVYNFFVTYANADGWMPKKGAFTSKHVMDRWIISKLNGSMANLTNAYDAYDTPKIVELASVFMRDLSQWYVRRIRDRVGPAAPDGKDKDDAYQTLWIVLTQYCKALAPIIPFMTEEIYRNLTGEESVHLTSWPQTGKHDEKLEKQMEIAQKVASSAHSLRKQGNVKLRMPLLKLSYAAPEELPQDLQNVLFEEINVRALTYTRKEDHVVVSGQVDEANQDKEGGLARDLVREIQQARKDKGCAIDEHITLVLPKKYEELPKELVKQIQQQTLTTKLSWGNELSISTG